MPGRTTGLGPSGDIYADDLDALTDGIVTSTSSSPQTLTRRAMPEREDLVIQGQPTAGQETGAAPTRTGATTQEAAPASNTAVLAIAGVLIVVGLLAASYGK